MFILPPGCIRFCKQTRDLKIYFRKPVIFRGLFVLPLKISGLPFFNHFLTKIISKKIKDIMTNIINKFSASKSISRPFYGSNRIAIIAGIFLMVSSGLFSCKNAETSNQQASQPTHAMDSLKVVTDSLQSQYSASRVEIDELTSKTALLDSQIRLKDKEIAKWKGQARKLEKKNKSLAAQMKKDGKLISDLKDELNGKSKEYAEKLGTLQSDRDNLAAQRDELMAKYNKLKALGSVLHASNFRIEPLHEKRNGREKATKRAKKVDMLHILFDIDENRIAEDGTKELYLVITGPDGKLQVTASQKGGTLTTSQGKTVNYSLMKNISLKQNEPVKDVSVEWKEEGEAEKGTYTIAIYNGGYRIGGGNMTLK